jgi:hypothetical protein
MNPDIQSHELADMRRAADKAPHDLQRKFHALLDAYEDQKESEGRLEEQAEDLKSVRRTVEDSVTTLRAVYSRVPASRPTFDEPPSEDAWAERLADCDTPEETAATKDEELTRARAAERSLLTRVEALEEAIESVLEELE